MAIGQRIQFILFTAIVSWAATGWADGPTDRQPGGAHGGSRISQAWRDRNNPPGPMRHHYGGLGTQSSLNLFFGVGPGFGVSPYWDTYPYGATWNMGWPPYYYGYGPTGIYYNPATNTTEYYLPPTYVPAELNYGPLAAERFLGIHRDPIVVPPAGAEAVPADDDSGPPSPADIVAKLRKSNDEAIARGRRFVEFGNALFQEQRFHEALQRYKSAIEAAPDQADTYLRQGFALIAVNQYRLAAKAFAIALQLDPNLVRSGFRLDDLYGANQLAKSAHLESLAAEALESPADGDLLFLVGITLQTNGEAERALRFFLKAAELGGEEAARLLAPLTGAKVPAEAVPAAPGDKGEKGEKDI